MNNPAKMTEGQVLDLLRRRHARAGNGGSGEFAFLTHVRNSAGFNSSRTFDAVVMSLWPSRGLELHAFEVKCSRSDWLRELKEPEKADAAAQLVDRFSVVVADADIVKPGELPPTWGLLVVKGTKKLECVTPAPLLPGADPGRPVRRDFLVAMLRANGAVPTADAAEVTAAERRGVEQGRAETADRGKQVQEAMIDFRDRISAFDNASGLSLRHGNAKEIGELVRSVAADEQRATQARRQLERARDELRHAATSIDNVLDSREGAR